MRISQILVRIAKIRKKVLMEMNLMVMAIQRKKTMLVN